MRFPVGAAEFVLYQRVRGRRVGNPQQRLRQAHQRHAFLAGQPVFQQKRVQTAMRTGVGANRRNQIARGFCDARAQIRANRACVFGEEALHAFALVGVILRAHAAAQRVIVGERGGGGGGGHSLNGFGPV